MRSSLALILAGAQLLGSAVAFPVLDGSHAQEQPVVKRQTCENPKVRKEWTKLTGDEQSAYVNAELCLMNAPSQLNKLGAKTRWDDLQLVHSYSANTVHNVGQFLPWHRYFVYVHAYLIENECNYTGPLPYWNETADLGNLAGSPIWAADAFGGDGRDPDAVATFGASVTRNESCITDGPFVNLTLNLQRLPEDDSAYCLSRGFSQSDFDRFANLTQLHICLDYETYEDTWDCLATYPHAAGHAGTSGVMSDVALSPGDPVFWLHHNWLDGLWWQWQNKNLSTRLTEMGGNNQESEFALSLLDAPAPSSAWLDYDGDDGNVTTLNHVIYTEILPNVTVGDVMDLEGSTICGSFEWPDY